MNITDVNLSISKRKFLIKSHCPSDVTRGPKAPRAQSIVRSSVFESQQFHSACKFSRGFNTSQADLITDGLPASCKRSLPYAS